MPKLGPKLPIKGVGVNADTESIMNDGISKLFNPYLNLPPEIIEALGLRKEAAEAAAAATDQYEADVADYKNTIANEAEKGVASLDPGFKYDVFPDREAAPVNGAVNGAVNAPVNGGVNAPEQGFVYGPADETYYVSDIPRLKQMIENNPNLAAMLESIINRLETGDFDEFRGPAEEVVSEEADPGFKYDPAPDPVKEEAAPVTGSNAIVSDPADSGSPVAPPMIYIDDEGMPVGVGSPSTDSGTLAVPPEEEAPILYIDDEGMPVVLESDAAPVIEDSVNGNSNLPYIDINDPYFAEPQPSGYIPEADVVTTGTPSTSSTGVAQPPVSDAAPIIVENPEGNIIELPEEEAAAGPPVIAYPEIANGNSYVDINDPYFAEPQPFAYIPESDVVTAGNPPISTVSAENPYANVFEPLNAPPEIVAYPEIANGNSYIDINDPYFGEPQPFAYTPESDVITAGNPPISIVPSQEPLPSPSSSPVYTPPVEPPVYTPPVAPPVYTPPVFSEPEPTGPINPYTGQPIEDPYQRPVSFESGAPKLVRAMSPQKFGTAPGFEPLPQSYSKKPPRPPMIYIDKKDPPAPPGAKHGMYLSNSFLNKGLAQLPTGKQNDTLTTQVFQAGFRPRR